MANIVNPIDVRNLINTYSEFDQDNFTDGRKGIILGKLNAALKQYVVKINKETDKEKAENIADDNRRMVLGFIFGNEGMEFSEKSSKELTFSQWRALERWVFGRNPQTKPDGSWKPRVNFQPEAFWILNVARAIKSMTETAHVNGSVYKFGTLIEAIRAHTTQVIPYSPEDYDDPENSGLVVDSLSLPGALPVKKTIYPNRKEYIPAIKPAPIENNVISVTNANIVSLEEDDEFII